MAVALSTSKIISPMLMISIDIIQGRQQIIYSYPFRTNSGLRTFYASANRLWNTLDDGTRSISTLRNIKKYISNKYVVNNSKLDHFTIHRTF